MAESLRQAVKADGIEVLTNTRANKLIVKDGRVIGVQAQGKNGTSYTINGNAVLLATGGYGANKDMLVEPLKSALFNFRAELTGRFDPIPGSENTAPVSNKIFPHVFLLF